MGSIIFSAAHFLESLSEVVGYKSGVAIGREELDNFFNERNEFSEFSSLDNNSLVRIRSDMFADIVEALLYKLGRLESSTNTAPGASLFYKHMHDENNLNILMSVQTEFFHWLDRKILGDNFEPRPTLNSENFVFELANVPSIIQAAAEKISYNFNSHELIDICHKKHGLIGLEMAESLIHSMEAYMLVNPWIIPPESQWKDIIQLRDLFVSEGLNTSNGNFFDQRYIDYLNHNFDDISKMNWRKFEHLTAEYFDRTGYKVELGPGRGDDGVDVRAWRADKDSNLPPQIIVQCKRQKADVEKVIVKALYADIIHENAESGMIVTTSRLAPGAVATSTARNYPIRISDRQTLRRWLEELRVPGTGIVM